MLYIDFHLSYLSYILQKWKTKEAKKQNLEFNIEKKVLSFELWFFAFRFKFLAVYDN